ncbi:MAG: sigma-70 family RNA polymerase sigma factor [Chloroflexota bacterium]|mgnify:FL=1
MSALQEGAIGPATDRSTVDRARHGDLSAFESIVRDRMDAVYRLSLAILGDEADAHDATQEAFVAAWRQIGQLRDADAFDAWLGRITVNAARMTLRSARRRRVREIPSSEVDRLGKRSLDEAHDRTFVDPTDGTRLADALRSLSLEQRSLLALHHLDGRSVAEIAEVLEIPIGTVKSRLFTARRALDAALGTSDTGEATR